MFVARQHHGPPRLNPMYAGYAGQPAGDMNNGRVEEIARALYAAVSLQQNCECFNHCKNGSF